jgi:Protein tyrosine and serine/threonine kinase
MNGRLRLDKLSNSIESFLCTKTDGSKINEQQTAAIGNRDGIQVSEVVTNEHKHVVGPPQSPHRGDIEPTGPLYYQVERTPEPYVINEKSLQEIKSAVPLAEFLTKTNSQADFRPLVPNNVRKYHHNYSSTPSIPSLRFSTQAFSTTKIATSTTVMPSIPAAQNATVPNDVVPSTGTTDTVISKQRNKRRVLLDRPATSFLDDSERNVLVVNTASSVSSMGDYVTVQPYSGIGSSYLEQRVVPLIPFDELMLIETIGSGRVSTIYRAAWQKATSISSSISTIPSSNIRMVALKVAMVNPITNDTANVDELRREADIAARLEHSNVVELVGVAADPECFCLAYDYCDGGSLLSLLSDHTRYYEYLPIALDIANGMAYLHSRNVIHRDLKPSNILMTRDHRAKIADFGMSVANFGQELTAETGTYRYDINSVFICVLLIWLTVFFCIFSLI